MKTQTTSQTVEVKADGEGLVSHAGAFLLTELADLLGAHSEKERAAPAYKNGFGFFPLLCFLDETGEPLAGVLRPGNAGANTAADHFEVLALALEQLPARDLGRSWPGPTSAAPPMPSPPTAATPGSASRSAMNRRAGSGGDPRHARIGMAERDRSRWDRARGRLGYRVDRHP